MVALLVTPAATANLLVHRLMPMMFVSALIGASSSILGFYLSYHQDIATGPAIVLTATVIFLGVFFEQQIVRSGQRWLDLAQQNGLRRVFLGKE
jgi:ABC-type Mn2+/Zn2+ transport system permease subunit